MLRHRRVALVSFAGLFKNFSEGSSPLELPAFMTSRDARIPWLGSNSRNNDQEWVSASTSSHVHWFDTRITWQKTLGLRTTKENPVKISIVELSIRVELTNQRDKFW